ncbi:DUF5333 family protein [Salipiger sp.]|uniref:DUF5333 family protein n=1 Tax=Salipiger sp. TaxID=2078585 RepID=UPI003A986768
MARQAMPGGGGMTELRAYGVAALLAVLAGCGAPVSTGGGAAGVATTAPAGNTVAERWKAQVLRLTLAERISDQCYAQGLRLAPGAMGGAVNLADRQLLAEGATRAELDALFTAHDFNETATAANGWLAARGAIPDVPESLCRIGTTEIAQGSDVGRLLEQV